MRSEDHRAGSGQRHHLPDGSSLQHHHLQRDESYGTVGRPGRHLETKREGVSYAFSELENAGYTRPSAYTAVKNPTKTLFVYTDLLWSGADMVGLGVASFSHVQGTHFQNEHEFETYSDKLRHGVLPIYRALTLTQEQRMIRELILQMKLGH